MPASDLPDPQREILNIDEAAAYLGVSSKTFARVLRDGEIPGRKVGREWKFSRKALEAWIGNSRSADFLDREEHDDEEAVDGAASSRAPTVAPSNAAPTNAAPRAIAAAAGAGAARRSATRSNGAAFEAEED